MHPNEQKCSDCFISNDYILCPRGYSLFLYLNTLETLIYNQIQVTYKKKFKNLKICLEDQSGKDFQKYAYKYHEYIN